jgi:hypothetical protein
MRRYQELPEKTCWLCWQVDQTSAYVCSFYCSKKKDESRGEIMLNPSCSWRPAAGQGQPSFVGHVNCVGNLVNILSPSSRTFGIFECSI